MITHSAPMALALKQASVAAKRDEVPVGAVIVDSKGNLIAKAGNQVEQRQDPTAHAEMMAIRAACKKLGEKWLEGCDIYVTLEPCPMCAQAISAARLRAVYFAAEDPKSGGIYHGPRVLSQPTAHHKPEVYSGIGESTASAQLKDFFKKKR